MSKKDAPENLQPSPMEYEVTRVPSLKQQRQAEAQERQRAKEADKGPSRSTPAPEK